MANDKNIDKIETSAAEELLEKIQELQEGHAYLKEEMSKLMIAGEHKKSDRQRSNGGGAALDGGGVAGPSAVKLTETHYVNIMQSIGQSVHMFDLNCQIIYWNRMAQNLYGYTVAEALGKTAPDIIIGPEYSALAALIIQRGTMGESWSGEFPVRNKRWERFTVITTVSPSCDESGNINGAICVSTDARPFQELKFGLDPQQPQKMASKVKSKIKTNTDHESRSEDNHYSDIAPFDYKGQSQCGASSSRSTLTNSIIKVGIDIENLDVEILWDDLIIREQIGQGTCGTVYRALWDGSDVAVKVFPTQEYPKDVILSFRKEVCLMKRLRHPNIQLFMGAVTSPHHLCIVTEFLPRGSLFRLLQRNTTKLDWRRRVHMAMDIARGINYLHHCHPPIVHLDLRSSNLLIDKNWTVKVGDFGLSRIKHETYLTTKTGNGTPQWMAPEILRCEQANEKSDVYSYGVVLWEITTENIPWDNLDPTQVIGTVGFMNHRLKIPEGVDPQWASLIESCCSSEPESRPTFHEILTKLKDLQKKFAVQFQTPRRRQKGS